MFAQRTKRINAEIDMTPLIDVVFQLLIFLMVSSQFTKQEQKVDLPTGAVPAENINFSQEKLILTIQADSQLLLNKQPFEIDEFEQTITHVIEITGIKRLEIRGDQSSELGIFIKIVEIAKLAGIEELSYHKKPQSEN
jgi:biopolymer transport protein ExbD|tara:strand:- start:2275 stop:2688 length:414 start_codon:yes stop_codon:yes gene_type:complete